MKQVERYFYPAVFSYAPDQEIAVTFPDLDVATSGTDDTDALLIAATYIYRRRERDDLPRIRHQPAGCGIYVQKRQNLQRRRQVHPVARRPVYDLSLIHI